jgi:hypothetical protein
MSQSVPVGEEELRRRYFNLGIIELGASLTTLGNVLQQDDKASNNGALGGVAVGLERSAAHFRGESFRPMEPLQKRLLENGPKLLEALDALLVLPETKSGHGAQTFNALRVLVQTITDRKTGQ